MNIPADGLRTAFADLHAVVVDEDLVILDVRADAYNCLPDAAPAWRDLLSHRATDNAKALADALAANGLHTLSSPHESVGPTLHPLRRTALCDGVREPARPRDILNLCGAWLDLRIHYDGRSLAHILTHAAARHAPTKDDPDPELLRLCRVFRQTVIWLPVSGKCLVRSFLLLRFLQRSGRDAHWVFAVSTWPFVAHCWLQVADTALDDRPDRVRGYVPIAVF